MVFTIDYLIFFCLYHRLESKDKAFTLFMTTEFVRLFNSFFQKQQKVIHIFTGQSTIQILTGEASKHKISLDESYIYMCVCVCIYIYIYI